MTLRMFGIANCDTIKRAKAWLSAEGIAFDFHDYKKSGADPALLQAWVTELGWEVLLNRAGTTFRALPDADKQNIDTGKAIALMLANPSMIKRPVLDLGGRRIVGFKPDVYAAELVSAGTEVLR
ncbi:arsenate reductase [Novosphingobium arvoryzae]|uniref:Arsenate reductase n=1 Tax=Novosphingobium arvoryzae TaxID=1256514 RepID=A0A918RB28_9SPHN|nr:arsenate reductase [Novosphingobium arvoryzae]GGZ93348.1 arsenate reductase [Novosphingobium arvoryzae]